MMHPCASWKALTGHGDRSAPQTWAGPPAGKFWEESNAQEACERRGGNVEGAIVPVFGQQECAYKACMSWQPLGRAGGSSAHLHNPH